MATMAHVGHIGRAMRTGGQILIDQLAIAGINRIFTVPGESFIAALDAMHDGSPVRPIVCRHEGGAAMMAEASGKLTGRPGFALVTRGPGASNAVSGVYVAHQDATPMVLLVGLPPAAMGELPAFQFIDLKQLFGGISKLQVIVEDVRDIAQIVSTAIATSLTGKPGPVIVGLPEDVLTARAASNSIQPIQPPLSQPPSLKALRDLIARSRRPLAILGSSTWSASYFEKFAAFADRFDLPVAASFRRQDHIDNSHHCYIGHAGIGMSHILAGAIRDADVLICIGPYLGDISTRGFTLIEARGVAQKLVAIGPELSSFPYRPDLAIVSDMAALCDALGNLPAPKASKARRDRLQSLKLAHHEWSQPRPTPGKVKLEEIVVQLNELLPDDAIIANGAGNYAAFLHRYYCYRRYGTQLAPTSGSMGYGLPAAIAAALEHPGRTVIVFAGDGCFQMTGQEVATAIQFNLPLIVIVADNHQLGTIRMHQERTNPGRVVATSLINPDFADFARSFGAYAETVRSTDAFAAALRRCLAKRGPSLIHLLLDPEAISPTETITSIRNRAK